MCEYLTFEIEYITLNSVWTWPSLQVIEAKNVREINKLQSGVNCWKIAGRQIFCNTGSWDGWVGM